MDFLTKVKHDHQNIAMLIQDLINRVKEGENDTQINNKHILLEDLFEEIKEEIQAEKVCILEMISKKGNDAQLACWIDKDKILHILSQKFYDENLSSQDKDLEHKLERLKTLLHEHDRYIEDIIMQLSNQSISAQESEELTEKFEQEKINTLRSSIMYG